MNEYNHFVTTYRKDYLWPYGKSFPVPGPDERVIDLGTSAREPATCDCKVMDDAIAHSGGDPLGRQCTEQQWSRLGPMGPLLDAKLFPVKVGATPVTDSSRAEQPNAFLDRLHEKYPMLYDVLKTTPEEELLFRVMTDRMHTTYQIDYCGMSEYPAGKYDLIMRGARNKDGLDPCKHVSKLPDDPCHENQKPIAYRFSTISKQPTLTAKECCQASSVKYSKYTTEYRDYISRMGGLIMKEHIHKRFVD